MTKLPQTFQKFARDYPKVHEAYEALARAAHESGPLNQRMRQLVKLAISVGASLEGAVRAHTWQAREAGVTEAEIDHVVLLSLTTVGQPSMEWWALWMI